MPISSVITCRITTSKDCKIPLINASATVAMGVYVAWKTSGDKNELKQEFNERLATLDKDLRAEMKILDKNLRAEMKATRVIVQGGERCVTSGVTDCVARTFTPHVSDKALVDALVSNLATPTRPLTKESGAREV